MPLRPLDEATLSTIDEKLSGCRVFKDAAVFQRDDKLYAVIQPDLAQMWNEGSANVQTIVRVKLAEIALELGVGDAVADFAIMQEALPRAADGMLIRTALPYLFDNWKSGSAPMNATTQGARGGSLLDGKIGQAVWQFFQFRFPGHDLNLDNCLRLELDLDSLDWLELLLDLERETGIALTESQASKIITLRDMLNACQESPTECTRPELSISQLRSRLLERPEHCEWLRPRRAVLGVMTRAVYYLTRMSCRLAFRLSVEGLEHLPESGPAILAPNHLSDLDVPVMMGAVPKRLQPELCWAGNKERLFATKMMRVICRGGHVFPVDDRIPVVGLSSAIACLRASRFVVWFPEGWRSPTGEIQPFLRGIGLIAQHSGAPVIPVSICGSFEAWPRNRRLPRPRRISVVFGAPIIPSELEANGCGEDAYAKIADGLRRRLVAIRDRTQYKSRGLFKPK